MSPARKLPVDPFLLAIITAAVFASILPATGIWVNVVEWITTAAIALLFFLYGARLSPAETVAGLKHWRLHATILTFTYVVFPLGGLAVVWLAGPMLGPGLATGVLYLSLVPSTVQSSIAFTSIAKGNVAGAVVSASASNILGVFLTPVLCWVLLSSSGQITFTAATVIEIVLQIFLPFVAGQLSRRWVGGYVAAHPELKLVDRGSIVLVVYGAFSAGMREGMWTQVSWQSICLVVLVCLVLLAVMLVVTWRVSKWLGFSRADVIAIQFCGTKKSLASGLPMAGVIFAGQPIGLMMLPLMIFHQMQLMACSVLAARYAREADEAVDAG